MANNLKESLLARLYYFIFGATIVGETVVTSLIVTSLGGEVLNKLYLLNGALLFILPSLFYSRIDRQNRGELLKRITLIAMGVVGVLFVIYSLMNLSSNTIATFILLLFYPFSYLLKTLLFLTFWTVANDITDASESKVIFPEVAAFGFLGGLSGAILSRLLLVVVSAEWLLLFWGVLYGVAYGYSRYLSRQFHSSLIPQESISKDRREGVSLKALKTISDSPLLKNISLLYFFTYVAIFMLDYYFWMQCGKRYAGSDTLTKFSFSFYMFYSVITFFMLRRVTPTLIADRGVAVVFSYMPKLLLIGGGVYLFAIQLPHMPAEIVFAILILWQLIRIVTFENFFSPVYQMFFTSIEKEQRGRAKTAIEGLVKPSAIIFSGAILWMLEKHPIVQIAITIIASICMLVVSKYLRNAYVLSLSNQRSKKVSPQENQGLLASEQIIDIMASYMFARHYDMQKLAVDLLISMNSEKSVQALENIVSSNATDRLKMHIATEIGYMNAQVTVPLVQRLLEGTEDQQAKVLQSLATHNQVIPEFERYAKKLNQKEGFIKLVGAHYLAANKPLNCDKELAHIRQVFLDGGPDSDEALWALASLSIDGWRTLFIQKFGGVSLEVFHKCCQRLTPKITLEELQIVLNSLERLPGNYQKSCFKALVHAPLKAVVGIDTYLLRPEVSAAYGKQLLKIVVEVRKKYPGDNPLFAGFEGAKAFGLRQAENSYMLGAHYFKAFSSGQKYAIRPQASNLFERAIKDDLLSTADTLFDILVILEGFPYLLSSREELKVEKEDDRARLIEIIETTRDSSCKDLLIPLLEKSSWETYFQMVKKVFPLTENNEVFLYHENNWVVWCSLYWYYDLLHEIPHKDWMKSAVSTLLDSEDRYIRKSAQAVAALWGGAMELSENSFEILDKVFFLKQIDLFNNVSAAKLVPLAREAQLIGFEKDEIISREGDVANHLYIIKTGIVGVFKGERQNEQVATLHAKEVYGAVGLFSKGARSASAVAKTDCQVYIVSRPQLKKLVVQIPEIANNLLVVYGQKLRESNEELFRMKKEWGKGNDF